MYGKTAPNRGKKHSLEQRLKMKQNHTGMTGRSMSEEHRMKLRKAVSRYVLSSGKAWPRIGRNERLLLDELENEFDYSIHRQHPVEGFFVDGYLPELNLVIEIDEKPKNKEKDIIRENIIKTTLKCEFLRIKDYENN